MVWASGLSLIILLTTYAVNFWTFFYKTTVASLLKALGNPSICPKFRIPIRCVRFIFFVNLFVTLLMDKGAKFLMVKSCICRARLNFMPSFFKLILSEYADKLNVVMVFFLRSEREKFRQKLKKKMFIHFKLQLLPMYLLLLLKYYTVY